MYTGASNLPKNRVTLTLLLESNISVGAFITRKLNLAFCVNEAIAMMNPLVIILLCFVFSFIGCSHKKQSEIKSNEFHQAQVASTPTYSTKRIHENTGVISIAGPTIIAYFVTTQKEIDQDSGGNISEALGDFQTFVNNIDQYSMTKGIRIYQTYKDTIRYKIGRKLEVFHPKVDSEKVGYIFINQQKKLKIQYGVMTDEDILGFAEEIFKIDSLAAKYVRPDQGD